MTAGPLPPHERAWRHPSELAAPAPEPPTRFGRMLILATATASLVFLGALAIQLAPRRASGPGEALVASTVVALAPPLGAATTAAAAPTDPQVPTGRASTAAGKPGSGGAAAAQPPAARPVAVARGAFGFAPERDAAGTGGGPGTAEVMVTPLAGGLAVTTRSALDGSRERLAAIVPSGETVVVDVIHATDDIAFVLIVGAHPDDTLAVATGDDATGDLYLAVEDPPMRLATLPPGVAGPPEGAPVVNADGALVGLCTYGPDGLEVVPIGAVPPAAGG